MARGRDVDESARGTGDALEGGGVDDWEEELCRRVEADKGAWGGEEEEGVEGACTLKVDTAMASVRLRVARVFRRVWMRSRTWVMG